MNRRLTPTQLRHFAAAQAPLNVASRADQRRDRGVEIICRLGPRVVGELLNVIGAKCSAGTLIDQEVERFSQLDPDTLAAIGADRFPPLALTVIRGGRQPDIGDTEGDGVTKDNPGGEE